MQNELTKGGILLKNTLDALFALPKVRVNREKFLKDTFTGTAFSASLRNNILNSGPVQAGVDRKTLGKLANGIIKYHTLLCSGTSFGLGIPGGLTMAATIPADITQFFSHVLITAQKIAYLYGFNLEEIPDETRYQVLVSLLTIGLSGKASDFSKVVAANYAKQLGKKIMQSGGTQYPLYKLINLCARALGFDKLAKKTAAQTLGKAVPLIGGVISGGITWVMFQKVGKRIQKHFEELAFNQRTQ